MVGNHTLFQQKVFHIKPGKVRQIGAVGGGTDRIDENQELERVNAVIAKAEEQGMTIVALHIGGSARRGTLSDKFIPDAFGAADAAIIVSEGDSDGIYEGGGKIRYSGCFKFPFVGFAVPLLLLTIPVAVFSALFLGLKQAKNMDYEKIEPHLNREMEEKYGFRIYIPLIVLVVLMMLTKVLKVIPDIGMPLIFLISAVIGLFTGRKVNVVETIQEALHTSLPVMGILMGVGMFIQVMPPTALAGLFAVQVTGVDNYVKVLKRCLIPMAVMLVYGLIFIYFSKPIAALF